MAPALLLAVAALTPLPRAFPIADPIQAFAVSPDGRHFACARDTNWADIFDANTGTKRHSCRCADGDMILSLAFSPDGKTLAAGAQHTNVVRTWDVATGDPLPTMTANTAGVRSVAFSLDGKWLACGGDDGQVRVLDIRAGRQVEELNERHRRDGIVSAVAFHPNGRWIAAGSDTDDFAHLWRIAPHPLRIRRLLGHRVTDRQLVFAPNGRALLRRGNGIELVETASGGRWWGAEIDRRRGWYDTVGFSPSGRTLLAACSDGRIDCWDASDGVGWASIRAHEGRVLGFGFGVAKLFSVGEDQKVRVREWDEPAVRSSPVLPAEEATLVAAVSGVVTRTAFRAMARLSADPETAVRLARVHLKPAPGPDARTLSEVRRLVNRLGADDFEDREAADRALTPLAPGVLPVLWRLQLSAEPEVAYRLGRLTADYDPDDVPAPAARWLEVLERVGTPAAAAVVREIAGGDPDAALTRDAVETLRRMGVRGN